eukprot:1671850-Rhodomonas_salina.1
MRERKAGVGKEESEGGRRATWLWTPPTAQRTRTAPSSTRSARSTSIVKSTCPGVSMMFTA